MQVIIYQNKVLIARKIDLILSMDNTVQQACNTIQNDKDETLLDMSCKDNMELILETRLLQTLSLLRRSKKFLTCMQKIINMVNAQLVIFQVRPPRPPPEIKVLKLEVESNRCWYYQHLFLTISHLQYNTVWLRLKYYTQGGGVQIAMNFT